MLTLHGLFLFVLIVAIQCVGIFSVVVARLSERSWAQAISQYAFFASLSLVGIATIAYLYLGSSNWLPCAATLGVMAVGATLDLRPAQRTVYF
jgi:hypothetical protein